MVLVKYAAYAVVIDAAVTAVLNDAAVDMVNVAAVAVVNAVAVGLIYVPARAVIKFAVVVLMTDRLSIRVGVMKENLFLKFY